MRTTQRTTGMSLLLFLRNSVTDVDVFAGFGSDLGYCGMSRTSTGPHGSSGMRRACRCTLYAALFFGCMTQTMTRDRRLQRRWASWGTLKASLTLPGQRRSMVLSRWSVASIRYEASVSSDLFILQIPTLASCSFDELIDAAQPGQVQFLQLSAHPYRLPLISSYRN